MLQSRVIGSLILLMGFASVANGDLAPSRRPLPEPPLLAPVKIVEGNVNSADPNVVAKIIIPSNLLPDLQKSSNQSTRTRGSKESPYAGMTILAGIALTAAAISLLFVNRKGSNWKKRVIGFITCSLLVAGVLLFNFFFPPDITPPSIEQSQPQRLIVIEVQQYGHEITLVLPSATTN